VVRWIVDHGGPDVYLRQIDVPGVDTKFVENHRGLLGELLDSVLPRERIDPALPYRRFAERYQLATKPAYVRFRSLDAQALLPAASEAASGLPARDGTGPTELTCRVQEAGPLPLPGRRVVIIENETTYLALPAIPDTLAVLGGGYGISTVAALPWLQEREVHYWGDLDTHGFAILDRLRTILPTVRSLLMNRTTLETHRDHWGREPTPVNARLEHLTEPEKALYIDLVEDRYAPALRLEQERIRFAVVRCALEDLA
jgi:hypothetical protein